MSGLRVIRSEGGKSREPSDQGPEGPERGASPDGDPLGAALSLEGSVLRALLGSTPDLVYVKDLQGRFLALSASCVETIGRPEAEILGRTVHDLFAPARAEEIERLERAAADLDPPRPIDATFAAGGKVRNFSVRMLPLREGDSVVGCIGIARDVTERREAERARDESETRYRELFENAHDLIYSHDLEGRFLECNRRALEVSGYDEADIPSMNLTAVIPPEQLGIVVGNLERGIAGEPMPTVELDLIAKDGRRFPIEVNARILRRGGAAVAVQGIAREISERRAAEAALAEQAQVAAALARVGRVLISSLAMPTLLPRLCRLVTEVLSSDGSTSFLRTPDGNAFTAAANAGRSDEEREVLGAMLLPVEMTGTFVDRLRDADAVRGTAAGLSNVQQVLLRRFRASSWISMAFRRGEEVIGFQIAARGPEQEPFNARDERLAAGIAQLASIAIENARLVDEIERASRLKSEFVAMMSHELRTPLNIIIGYQDLLAEGAFGSPTDDQAEILTRLQLKSRELLQLIEATLDLSRIEGGRERLELADVSLPSLFAEIDAETRELRSGRPVAFSWHVDPPADHLRTDATKLKVILKNLTANAFKFTERGAVRIDAHRTDDELEIAVRDTGVGIAPDALEIIFEPFRQADASTTSRYGGVGLGLHIVRRLVEMLNGRIEVESRPGAGSCFRIKLPSHPAA
jgi:two-component system, sensor histidine kinase and response regulator